MAYAIQDAVNRGDQVALEQAITAPMAVSRMDADEAAPSPNGGAEVRARIVA